MSQPTLFDNFGIQLTDDQKTYDLAPDEWRKAMLSAIAGDGGSGVGIAGILADYEKTQQGGFQLLTDPVPASAEISLRPNQTSGFRFELEEAATVQFAIAPIGTDVATAAALVSITRTGMLTGTLDTYDEPLSVGETIFIITVTGVVKGRWVQR